MTKRPKTKNTTPLLIGFIKLDVGGVPRKIVDIVNFLGKYKPDLPIYIVLRNRPEFNLASEIKNKKVKIYCFTDLVHSQSKFLWPLFVPYEIYLIWRIKPGAILAFLDIASQPAIWARILFWKRGRLILSEDHYASSIVPHFTFGRLRHLLIKIFYRYADVIFTCSQANKEDLIENYRLPVEKIKIIKNWTTFTKIDNTKHLILNTEKKYDLIYIGRFFWTKNLAFLIRALNQLKRFKKDIKLCLLGEGQEEENLKKLVKKLKLEKNVDFVKPRPDVEKFLFSSKILVMSSLFRVEGLPVVLLEAMATKTPVLTRNFAGASEFLKDSKNCYLFRTEEEFIKKALWLLNDEKAREAIADRAYHYVKKYHSPENIKNYLKELNL